MFLVIFRYEDPIFYKENNMEPELVAIMSRIYKEEQVKARCMAIPI